MFISASHNGALPTQLGPQPHREDAGARSRTSGLEVKHSGGPPPAILHCVSALLSADFCQFAAAPTPASRDVPASRSQVSTTVSGFKETESMPSSTSHSAKSVWSLGPWPQMPT